METIERSDEWIKVEEKVWRMVVSGWSRGVTRYLDAPQSY